MIPIPFTNIALSLSGGGYRATTFHLGAMAYINEKQYAGANLLENVKIISTISGGTLTGVMYAMKLAQGENFQACFDKLYDLLEKDELVERALRKLNKPATWANKYKTRDVINAFAEVYNEEFYDQATFALLYDASNKQLTDAMFGASEFTRGLQFRFQEKGRFGNFYLNLPKEASRKIRLADATASSSCFPGGFEPMIMPGDFGNGPKSKVVESWNSKEYSDVPYPRTAIMDGGIIDNQGIEGVKLAESRHAEEGKPFIGTYIVSDVSGEFMKPYEVPEFNYKGWKNFFTFNTVSLILLIVAASLGGLIYNGIPDWAVIVCTCALTIFAFWFVFFLLIRGQIKKAIASGFGEGQVPKLLHDFKVIRSTPIYILIYLLKFRATSVMKMVSDVFLRRIRQLQYESLYREPEWDYRFKSNYIYSLEKDESLPATMKKVIKAANDMPTTLWFSDKEKKDGVLDDLIACGQLTMCRNLIKYSERLKTKKYLGNIIWDLLSKDQQKDIEELHVSMEKDWAKFLKDPYWLLNKNKEKKRA